MNSFNHYAYGAVGAWMYRAVAGLELGENEPGYRQILFRPRPGGSLTWAKAELEAPQGRVAISWKLEKGKLIGELSVPEGCRASFSAPEGYSSVLEELEPGEHAFCLALATSG